MRRMNALKSLNLMSSSAVSVNSAVSAIQRTKVAPKVKSPNESLEFDFGRFHEI
jgi:hypothetical protein